MDLTPEEKHRIYLEEKARLEAQERTGKERAQQESESQEQIGKKHRREELEKELKRAGYRRLGYGVILGGIALLVTVLYRPKDPAPSPPPPASQSSSQQNAIANDNFEVCRKTLIEAQRLDVLNDFKLEGPSPKVFVGPTWYSLPIAAKENFHRAVQCFVTAGKGGVNVATEYLDWRTGKPVAEISYTGQLKILP